MTDTPEQDFSEFTDAEQVGLLLGSPNRGQTDNSPDPGIKQPPQDPRAIEYDIAVSVFDGTTEW